MMKQNGGGSSKSINPGPGSSKMGSKNRISNSNAIGKESSSKMMLPESTGVRLNKCLHELSRRGADDAIAEGRVTINNIVATNGMRVQKRDIVRLVRLIKAFHFKFYKEMKTNTEIKSIRSSFTIYGFTNCFLN